MRHALFNAALLPKVQLGLTKEEVRTLMQHDAERFEARVDGDHKIEVWKYMQDYDQERMTSVTFADGRVTAIASEPWDE